MFSVKSCAIPDNALLNGYVQEGTYTDCYMIDIPRSVSHQEFIIAFYTTLIFKLERLILKLAVSRPSTDVQVSQLAAGEIDSFAAWNVEGRGENQLLLCDFQGRTRSWLMVMPIEENDNTSTRLFFGSAVVPKKDPQTGELSLGFIFRALLGFHKIYSVVLLSAVKLRLNN